MDDLSFGSGMCGGLICEWSAACVCQSFIGGESIPIDGMPVWVHQQTRLTCSAARVQARARRAQGGLRQRDDGEILCWL